MSEIVLLAQADLQVQIVNLLGKFCGVGGHVTIILRVHLVFFFN